MKVNVKDQVLLFNFADVADSKNKLELNDDVDETEHDSAPCRTTSPETIDQNDDLLDTASNIRYRNCLYKLSFTLFFFAHEVVFILLGITFAFELEL